MCTKYVVLVSVSVFVIICYLNEHYLSSTFMQLSAVYPQLHATVFYMRTVFLKLFSTGLSQEVPRKRTEMLFTKEALKKYSETSSGLYLAILGKVYDVGKGEKFYGPGGSYHFFTGL
jgi:Cytochrome b5-like Heme/Steroid binding domain.